MVNKGIVTSRACQEAGLLASRKSALTDFRQDPAGRSQIPAGSPQLPTSAAQRIIISVSLFSGGNAGIDGALPDCATLQISALDNAIIDI